MNKDFRIKIGFFRHHKTLKLQKRLDAAAVLALLRLWTYAAEVRPDGDLSGMTAEDIERAIGWKKKKSLVAALVEIGFLDGEEGSYSLHDWQDHNPWVSEAQKRSAPSRLRLLKSSQT